MGKEEGLSLNRNLDVTLGLMTDGLNMWLGESRVNFQNQWERRTFRKPEDMFTNRKLYLHEKVFAFLHPKLCPPSLVSREKGVLNSILDSRYTKTNRE